MPHQDEKLREDFHKEFDFAYEAGDDTREKEINFWLRVLHHEREQLIEEVEKMRDSYDKEHYDWHGYRHGCSDFISLIKK